MNKITVLFPGGFKPLTGAHMELANRYAKHPKVEKVIMLIGPKQRETITRDQTLEVFRILNKNSKIKMEETPLESPLAAAYEYLFNAVEGTYALAAGGKDDDYARVGQFISSIEKYKTVGDRTGKKINPNVNVTELKVSVTPLRYDDGKPISASSTRDAMKINSYDQFAQSYPGVDNKNIEKIYRIYKGTDKIFGEIPTAQTHTEAIFTRKWWNQVFEGLEESDPCWTGYKQVGTKKKGDRIVPNCVPESINEVDLPSQTWKDFDLRKLSEEDLQTIWDMYTKSYAAQGLDFSADDYKELQRKYKAVYLQDVDSDSIADAFIIYKETPYGNKISLLGTNNKPAAKSNLVKQLVRLVNTPGWFIEASKKVEDIMQRTNAPIIQDETIIQALVGDRGVKFLEDGYYERKLSKSPTRIIKRLYGKPKTSGIRESINEGGAGGHMAHPFDIPSVNTGKDLVRVFVQSEDYLTRKPASVKIDGVNASIRLVNVQGKRQFVLDRGSNKPLDVKGITKADLLDRFGAGHGMIEIGGKVLDIFDAAIPDTTAELKRLGLWDNPNILFNIEYVAGSTNVLSYNKNFLAIHGLLEIEQVTPKRRATHEIAYNKKALQDYINKLAPSANEYGYEVLGSVPTTLDGEPDFAGELNKKYTISINGKKQTKSLNDWLSTAKNPKDTMIKTKDGKTIGALSKQVLLNITNGMDVSDFVADPKDYQAAIDGYIFYLATMELGNAVLEVLSSPLGKVSEHEGIVIRDPKIYNKPFKITGRFIVKGLESSFR